MSEINKKNLNYKIRLISIFLILQFLSSSFTKQEEVKEEVILAINIGFVSTRIGVYYNQTSTIIPFKENSNKTFVSSNFTINNEFDELTTNTINIKEIMGIETKYDYEEIIYKNLNKTTQNNITISTNILSPTKKLNIFHRFSLI